MISERGFSGRVSRGEPTSRRAEALVNSAAWGRRVVLNSRIPQRCFHSHWLIDPQNVVFVFL